MDDLGQFFQKMQRQHMDCLGPVPIVNKKVNKMLFDTWDQKMQNLQRNYAEASANATLKEFSLLDVSGLDHQ